MRLRSHGVHLTNEARLLRKLRITKGLSMRAVGELCGKSDSFISQIEHGRIYPPTGAALERMLEIYGGLTVEEFQARAKRIREHSTDKEEIVELLSKTNDVEASMILKIVKAMIA